MSRYDQRTTMFSPEGRIYQVEYALQSIEHAGAAIGIVTADGIVLAAERRIPSELLDKHRKTDFFSSEKMALIDEHTASIVAGMTSDSHILINYAREVAQKHRFTFREPMPIEDIAERIANLKQSYTQYGGLRPFGAALLIAGYDAQNGLQLYHTDPSGNFCCWKAHAIGNGSPTATLFLKNEWKEGLTLQEGVRLALRAVAKVLDATLTDKKVEIGILRHEGGKVSASMLPAQELDEAMAEVNALAKAEEN